MLLLQLYLFPSPKGLFVLYFQKINEKRPRVPKRDTQTLALRAQNISASDAPRTSLRRKKKEKKRKQHWERSWITAYSARPFAAVSLSRKTWVQWIIFAECSTHGSTHAKRNFKIYPGTSFIYWNLITFKLKTQKNNLDWGCKIFSV